MESFTQEQFLALGLVGFVILGIAMLVSFAMMAGSLKLCISLVGNITPSYIACVGWLLAITCVNGFVAFGTLAVFGQTAMLLAVPLTWFLTLYMVSTAAECGLLRAFVIWLANSVLSTVGLVAIMFVMTIPLAMIGAVARAGMDDDQAEVVQAERAMAEMDPQNEAPDRLNLPVATRVGFQPGAGIESAPNEGRADEPDNAVIFVQALEMTKQSFAAAEPVDTTQPESQADSKAMEQLPRKPAKSRRAPDGSMINPFFQD